MAADFPADVYCLCYNNKTRHDRMEDTFSKLGWTDFTEIYPGVGPEDPRIKELNLSSCMLGHMDMISKFYYESEKEYGIFCEDDICIHDELGKHLPAIIDECKKFDIQLVMFGYLMNYNVDYNGMCGHCLISTVKPDEQFKIYTYNDEFWGTQMYMISKTYAKELLEKYGLGYAMVLKNNPDGYTSYCADWIITKKTKKRAIVFPPLCIENGDVDHYEHHGQRVFHKESYTKHVNEHFVGIVI
jgi:Glycosyltransferase family 25 (LPS biosynthesis protein)